MPVGGAGRFAELFRAFRPAECRCDARLADCPADCQFGHGMPRGCGNPAKFLDQVEVLLILVALEHGVFPPAIVWKALIAAEFPGQQPLQQGPIDKYGDAVLAAPGERIGFDLTLEHIVRRLIGRQGTDRANSSSCPSVTFEAPIARAFPSSNSFRSPAADSTSGTLGSGV